VCVCVGGGGAEACSNNKHEYLVFTVPLYVLRSLLHLKVQCATDMMPQEDLCTHSHNETNPGHSLPCLF
jgi:hypothetical protein